MRSGNVAWLVVLLGCGDSGSNVDGGVNVPDASDVASQDASSTDVQSADVPVVEAGPVYGLDSRPSNTTCLASNGLPQKLSQTGCFDALNPTIPASVLIPYDVNMPLWSDGATKRRWIALPDGLELTVDSVSGDYDLPVGGVAIKEFSVNGHRVETRFIQRVQSTKWNMGSYLWAPDESDATLGTGPVSGSSWTVMSPAQCPKCHTNSSKIVLGVEQVQLDRDFLYASTGRTANQVDTLIHIGALDARTTISPLPHLDDVTVPAEQRALAYLHANCSGCHQPTEVGKYDARWITPFANKNLCNVVPTSGDLGDSTNRLILPGQPLHSIVRLRIASTDPNVRMPPLGTQVVHTDAVAVFDAWISGLSTCP